MKLIYSNDELEQRSAEWLELRREKIGGSDVATVLGVNPYETAEKLWKYKTNRIPPKDFTFAMQRGSILEAEALEKVKQQLEDIPNLNIEQYFVIDPDYTYASASYDGVDIENKFIVELKCPVSQKNFKCVFEDGIQTYYYPQVQWQLMIANKTWGIDKGFFCSYYPEGAYITNLREFTEEHKTLAMLEVDYDIEYCQDAVKVVEKFHEFIRTDRWDSDEYEEVRERFHRKHYLSPELSDD